MFGLVIIGLFAGYLWLSVWVVKRAKRYAREIGESPAVWGWGAAIGMYLLVFWDWIPTVLIHRHYCETEAGFFVYESLEQWVRENPDVAKTLHEVKTVEHVVGTGCDVTYKLNERLFRCVVREPTSAGPLNVRRTTRSIVDSRSGKELARLVDFARGNSNLMTSQGSSLSDYKFWMAQDTCFDRGDQSERNAKFGFLGFERRAKQVGEDIRHDSDE